MTLTFHRYGSTDKIDELELDETKSSIIDKLNEPSRLSAILTSETAPQIVLGNYTDYGGTRYYVTKEPTVRKEHSQLYTVEVDLERSLGLARITILANPVDHRTTFDYTGTATEHLQLIVDCLNAKYEEVELTWTRGAVHCKDTIKHIKYDGATVLGALQQIRETYETDIFADGETLSLGQEEDKTTALPLAYGKGKGLLSGLERHKHTDDTVPTRLYVTGTKRNMTKGRLTLEKDVILSVDLKSGAIERVTGGVPTAGGRSYYRTDPTGQYIAEWSSTDKFFQSSRRFPTEATYTNEEIYPSHVSTIKSVTKVKDHFEVNSDFNYDKFRIAGEQMQVVFQTGNLAGRDFDAKYYPSTDRLAIVPKEEDDTTLPSDTLCPKVGDQYIVTGIKLPDEYIREAERNLTDEALRHLIKLQETRYSYKADIDPVYLHDNHDKIAPQLAVGRYVRLTDPQIAIGDPYVRIVGKRTYLDRPYTPEIELSNEVEPRSELTRVLNELDRQDDGLASIIDRLRQSGVLLSNLTLSSDAMRQRVEAAEEALTGKLDSGDFSKWRTGELAEALASKQPKGSYVDPSQLDASKQQAVAEAVERAEELDKKLKVGGRNLIRAGYFEKVYFRSDTDKLISYDDKDKKITYIGKASRWNSWVWLSDMEDVTTINLRKAIGEYTLSFSVRGRGTVSFEVVGNYKTNYSDYKTTVQTLTEDWQRVSCPFTRSAEDSSLFCLYNDKPETGDWVQFADDWKLERGTVATDWTPAPEDVAESVSKVSKSLEELSDHPLTVDDNGYWQIWSVKDNKYVTTQYQSRGRDGQDAGRYLGRAKRIHPDFTGNYLLETDTEYKWLTAKEGDYVYLVGDAPNRGGDKDTYYIVREHTSKTVWEVYNIKGSKPVLTLDSQYHLLADGEMVSMQSLRGEAGHTPELHVGEDDYLYVDGIKQRYVKGDKGDKPVITLNDKYQLLADGELVSAVSLKGEAGHTPAPEDVLHAQGFQEMLDGAVWDEVKPVRDDLSTANTNIADLSNRSLTLQQKEDLVDITDSLQVLRSGSNNTLEGLALQRIIALSGNGKDISAYLASNALPAVLKAGITNFGTPQEREEVAINHNGTGHLGNLYFAGNQIDFRTDEHTDPYLSIGAEESQFIDNFIATARIDEQVVYVSAVALTTSKTSYQDTATITNNGTRLTINIDDINVATYNGAKTRLTLDGEVLAEWRGTISVSGRGGGGIVIDPQYSEHPYKASNLSYERVVKAGKHTLRLEIVQPTDGATATIRGLRVRQRYDTGAQQSVLTKSGLRLFGSPDRYLDVDYRRQYYNGTPGSGVMIGWLNNPYTVRIKGGAKVDRLKVDKIEGAGAHLPSIVTPQLGLGGQTTLYPKYDEWVLTSDSKDQYISFSGLSAEKGRSIYIQTRRKAYLYANGHSFFGLPSVSDNQWLTKNTTYRFVRAEATAWLVTASSSPYPWT